jgi:hypothetical protein
LVKTITVFTLRPAPKRPDQSGGEHPPSHMRRRRRRLPAAIHTTRCSKNWLDRWTDVMLCYPPTSSCPLIRLGMIPNANPASRARPPTAKSLGAAGSSNPSALLARAAMPTPIVAPVRTDRLARGVRPPGTAWPVAMSVAIAAHPRTSPTTMGKSEELEATPASTDSSRKLTPIAPARSSDVRRFISLSPVQDRGAVS